MDLDRRHLRALIALGFVLGVIGMPVLAYAVGFLSNSTPVQQGVTLHAPNGPAVNVSETAEVNLTDPYEPGEVTVNSSEGNISLASSGRTNVTVTQINGTWTNTTGIDADAYNLTIHPEDKQTVVVGQDIDTMRFRSMSIDDGQVDFVYGGTSGTSTVTITGLPANTQVGAADVDSNTVLGVATTDSNGTVTFSNLPNSEHRVALQTGDAPIVNNSSATPDGQEVSQSTVTLEINVSDPDLPNDNLTVEFYWDGAKFATKHVTSNGTVSASKSNPVGGTHNWSVVVTDEYGLTTNSSTFSVGTPDSISIYNESAPSQKLDNVTVSLRFYYRDDPLIVNRTTSNGTINMTGLPAGRSFVVVAKADGYVSRRVWVPSLVEAQRIYLLPKSEQYVETNFVLKDYSGRYEKDDTVLVVQRALNGSWQTVEGDYFGATGKFAAQLRYNVRHRLIIQNVETGERRVLGPYTPLSSGEQIIQVNPNGTIDFVFDPAVISYEPGAQSVPGKQNATLNVTIANATDTSLRNYTVRYVYVNKTNVSNTTVLKVVNGSEPTGETIAGDLNLSNRSGGQVKVQVTYRGENGRIVTQEATYQVREYLPNKHSLVSVLGDFEGAVPQGNWGMFSTMAALIATVLVTTMVAIHVPMSTELVGLVALTSMVVWNQVGWLPTYVVFIAGAAWLAFAALRRGL